MTTGILQLLRNKTIFESKSLAINGIVSKLKELPSGSPIIASYNNNGKVMALLGISLGDNNVQIFEGNVLGDDGNLEIQENVKTAIDKLQSELDNTQLNCGLNENGDYEPNELLTYISGATSLKDADEKLDAAIKELSESISSGITNIIGTNGIDAQNSDSATTLSLKLNSNDKIMTVSEDGLLTNLSLKYIKKVTEGEVQPAKLQLVGKDDIVITDLDISDFIIDGMLSDVKLEDGNLTFTFNTDAGKEAIVINLSKYITVYTQGNGISISGNTISAKVKDNDTLLEVTENGIGTKNVIKIDCGEY